MATPQVTFAGTLSGKIDRDAEQALYRLRDAVNAAHAQITTNAVAITKQAVAPLNAAQLGQVQQALSALGSNPLNIQFLPGTNTVTTILSGTHAQRLGSPPTQVGKFWWETDRFQLYTCYTVPTWTWALGEITDTTAGGLFGDLGPNDAGQMAFGHDTGLFYVFSGNIWHIRSGVIHDTFGARPAPFVGADAGVIFCASDRGNQQWLLDFASGQWVFIGGGTPLQGTLPIPGLGLGAHDTGFQYWSTDFDRLYIWNGAGWEDGPGQPERGMIVWFDAAPPGAGWTPCNGGGTTGSTSTGGTGGVSTIDLTTTPQFLRSNTTAGGTGFGVTDNPGGGVSTEVPFTDLMPWKRL